MAGKVPLGKRILVEFVVHVICPQEPLGDSLCLGQGIKTKTVWWPAENLDSAHQ